jgi:lipoprotein NlpI
MTAGWIRSRVPRGGALVVVLLLALLAQVGLFGCSSYRGARLYEAGTRSLERGDASHAIRQLEEAAALVPQASEIQNHLGLAYLAGGRSDDALRAFDHALTLDCSNGAARRNLAAARAGRRPPTADRPADVDHLAGGGPSDGR